MDQDTSRMGDNPPSSSSQQLLILALQERLQSHLRPDLPPSRVLQQMLLGLNPLLGSPLDLGCTSSTPTHPLWQHQLCGWPGCEQPADTINAFLSHLSSAHPLDDTTTLQARQQIELVDSLEHRLGRERTRLQAMMAHLHMKNTPDPNPPTTMKTVESSTVSSNTSIDISTAPSTSTCLIEEKSPAVIQGLASMPPVKEEIKVEELSSPSIVTPAPTSVTAPPTPSNPSYRRSRVSDKAVLPISTDISKNRDFYRTNDVRPPYTYASLIRQAIMESPECQLTLNEIYNWFTDTFMYFRRNAATWKNAVRHNLSLHKCFARVEQNVKGAVWTVDDSEFYKRRSQRVNPTRSNPSTPSLTTTDSTTTMARRLLESRLADDPSSLLDPSHPFSSLLNHDNPLTLLAAASTFGSHSLVPISIDDFKPDVSSSAPPISCSVKEEVNSSEDVLSQIPTS